MTGTLGSAAFRKCQIRKGNELVERIIATSVLPARPVGAVRDDAVVGICRDGDDHLVVTAMRYVRPSNGEGKRQAACVGIGVLRGVDYLHAVDHAAAAGDGYEPGIVWRSGDEGHVSN